MFKRLALPIVAVVLAFPAIAVAFSNGDQVNVRTTGEVMRTLKDGRVVVATSGGVIVLPASAVSAVSTPTPSPTPTASQTPTASPSPSPAPTASATPTPTVASSAAAWPDETTTGVAGCPSLAPRDGDLTVQTGQTVQNLQINGALRFAAGVRGVTVKCVKVVTGTWWPVDTERDGIGDRSDITIDHLEVDCQGSSINVAGTLLFGVTVRHAWVHGCVDAYRFNSDVLLEDSLCKGLGTAGSDPHDDCAQTDGGDNATLRHNAFYGWDTSDVAVWTNLGPTSNVTVDGNLFAVDPAHASSPPYGIYVTKGPYGAATDVRVVNNTFRAPWPAGIKDYCIADEPVEWAGNAKSDGSPLFLSECDGT